MEIENIKSDLEAVKRVYLLLGTNPDYLQVSRKLDLKAQSVLKRLLDSELERLLAAYWKIVATAQLRTTDRISESHLAQLESLPSESLPHGSPHNLTASQGSSGRLKAGINATAPAWNEKNYVIPDVPPDVSLDQSQTDIFANGPESKRKRCRICEEKTRRQRSFCKPQGIFGNKVVGGQLALNQKDIELQEAQNLQKGNGVIEWQQTAGLAARSSNISVNEPLIRCNNEDRLMKNTDMIPNDFLKDVAYEVEKIETQLLLFHLRSGSGKRNNDACISNFPSTVSPLTPGEKASSVGTSPSMPFSHQDIQPPIDYQMYKGRFVDQRKSHGQNELPPKSNELLRKYKERDDVRQRSGRQRGGTEHRMIVQAPTLSPRNNMLTSQNSGQREKAGEFNACRQGAIYDIISGNKVESTAKEAAGRGTQALGGLGFSWNQKNSSIPAQPSEKHPFRNGMLPAETSVDPGKARPRIPAPSVGSVLCIRPGQKRDMSHKKIVKPTLLDLESQSRYDRSRDYAFRQSKDENFALKSPLFKFRDLNQSQVDSLRDCRKRWPTVEKVPQKTSQLKQRGCEEGSSTETTEVASTSGLHSSSSTKSLESSIVEGFNDGDREEGSSSEIYAPSSTQASSQWQTSSPSSQSANRADVSSSEKYGTEEFSTEGSRNAYPRHSRSEKNRYVREPYRLDQVKKKNTTGKLKRFTNKLGLILHHHHHHHHHHDSDWENGSIRIGKRQDPSRWKKLSKSFYDKSTLKAPKGGAGDRHVNSRLNIIPHRQRVGHFHSLLDGLMKHIRPSKKKEPFKNEISRLKSFPQMNTRQGMKKLHWWQIFQRQRGLRLPKRSRVKLGMKHQGQNRR